MANYKLAFLSAEQNSRTELECFLNNENNIFISIEDSTDQFNDGYIVLDIPTAIKFSKRIRTLINEAKSYENEQY